jgi:hypothetical protein
VAKVGRYVVGDAGHDPRLRLVEAHDQALVLGLAFGNERLELGCLHAFGIGLPDHRVTSYGARA